LNSNRNPGFDRTAIEAELCSAFGVAQIIWLGEGIEGDDTDGHIDDLARFVAADTVVTVVERNRDDPNFVRLQMNRDRLSKVRIADRPLNVIELPMPDPVFNQSQRLPASYANFYVANGLVLMPAFDCNQDKEAADVLAACFPERRVVAIDCRGLVAGLGALHCLTQQVPHVV